MEDIKQALLTELEKNRDVLQEGIFGSAKNNLDKLPGDTTQKLIETFKKVSVLKDLIDDYENKREEVLTEAGKELKNMKSEYKEQYKKTMDTVKFNEQTESQKKAEDILKEV